MAKRHAPTEPEVLPPTPFDDAVGVIYMSDGEERRKRRGAHIRIRALGLGCEATDAAVPGMPWIAGVTRGEAYHKMARERAIRLYCFNMPHRSLEPVYGALRRFAPPWRAGIEGDLSDALDGFAAAS